MVRASDDFYPRNEASSHPHVAACAFNSVFLGALAQPDWDMFHSKHPAAMLHATARALSGGAVYVSDYPGQHSFEILRKLVLPDGSILRALLPGRPARDSLFSDVLRDERSLLKVGRTTTRHPQAILPPTGNALGDTQMRLWDAPSVPALAEAGG